MYTHKQVQLVDSGEGLGEAFLSVHPQLISSFRQPQETSDPPMTKVCTCIICVCVCVSRSCLAHTVLTCMEYWSRGFGEAFLCSPPADFKPPATPRKHRCSQDEGLYIYINMCVFV